MGQQTAPERMLAGRRHRRRAAAEILLPTSAGGFEARAFECASETLHVAAQTSGGRRTRDSGRRAVSRELATLALDDLGAFA